MIVFLSFFFLGSRAGDALLSSPPPASPGHGSSPYRAAQPREASHGVTEAEESHQGAHRDREAVRQGRILL